MSIERESLLLENELDSSASPAARAFAPNWVVNAAVLWDRRRLLARVAAIALVISLAIAFLIPKRYESTARIMPPENGSSGTAMLAALAGRSLGGGPDGLGALAASFLGGRGNGALYVDLLRSGTVTGALIDRFGLQQTYHKRYRVDTTKYLLRHTSIAEDKKSGVITVTVTDTDPSAGAGSGAGLPGPTESAPEPHQYFLGASRAHVHRAAPCFGKERS